MEKDGVIQCVTSTSVSATPVMVVGMKESEDVHVWGDFSVTYNASADVSARNCDRYGRQFDKNFSPGH